MSSFKQISLRIAFVAVATSLCVFASEESVLTGGNFGPREASAWIGRPWTPLSYAGVARRTTRRAVYAGAMMSAPYYGPYGPGPIYGTYGPACYYAHDAYGRPYYRCP